MELMLTVTNPPSSEPAFVVSHRFQRAGGAIGRGADCVWQLPDASRRLSNQHAQVGFEDGEFFIEDLSTNGLFINRASTALGKGRRHIIRDEDEFLMGPFMVKAHLWAKAEEPTGLPPSISSFFDELEGSVAGAGHSEIADQLAGREHTTEPRQAPADDDLERELEALAWALDAVDVPDLVTARQDEKKRTGQKRAPVVEASAAGRRVTDATSLAHDDQSVASRKESVVETGGGSPEQEALQVFLRELGLSPGLMPQDALEPFMQGCAQLLRGSLKALMELLALRTEQKNRYHLGLTLIQRQENNPLKYSVNETQAIKQLLLDPQPECLPAEQALVQATDDLIGHSQAMESAYQDLIREVVQFVAGEEMADEAEAARRGWMDRRAQKRALQKRLTTLCDEEVLQREFFEHRFAKLYQGALSGVDTRKEDDQ